MSTAEPPQSADEAPAQTDPVQQPRRPASPDRGAGTLLMVLLIASLAMGLAALLAFYLIMGWQAHSKGDPWPPAGTPRLPQALWLSTAVIIASSVTMHLAVRSARQGRRRRLAWLALLTTLLGVLFLILQTWNWFLLAAREMPASLNMFAACFYLLTGAHGLHILAGLVPLVIVTTRAFRGDYAPHEPAGIQGVRHCAWFWHFLDVVWLVIFVALMFTQR